MTAKAWEVARGVLVVIVSTAVISAAVSLYRIASSSGPFVGGIPDGAVVAFDSTECPNGWREEVRARGRFVVGTGRHVAAEYDVELARLQLRDDGGSRTHRLTVPEMPTHTHRSLSSNGYDSPRHTDSSADEFGDKNAREDTTPAGENMPHNNMPPFLVLQFCIKD